MTARRDKLPMAPAAHVGAHAGLLLDRFLDAQEDHAKKTALLESAIAQKSDKTSVYGMAYARWTKSVETTAALAKDLPVQGRLISGLGIASPLETGISLHHTYGVPWLPGSGLKGLASHYCGTVWGDAKEEFRLTLDKGKVVFQGEHHKLLFGTNEESGLLVFHDGWWVPEADGTSGLMLDVMTPHHGDYYMGKQDTATDFDMPVPVSFLSVKGKFSVAVECPCAVGDEGNAKNWADLGIQLLTEALANWGFGGKTNAGYGRIGNSETPGSNGVSAKSKPAFVAPTTINAKSVGLHAIVVDASSKPCKVSFDWDGAPAVVIPCSGYSNAQKGDLLVVDVSGFDPKKGVLSVRLKGIRT